MYLILSLSNNHMNHPGDEYKSCFTDNALTASQYINKDGFKVFKIDGLVPVLDIKITTEDVL